jgi:hypothetical protein
VTAGLFEVCCVGVVNLHRNASIRTRGEKVAESRCRRPTARA